MKRYSKEKLRTLDYATLCYFRGAIDALIVGDTLSTADAIRFMVHEDDFDGMMQLDKRIAREVRRREHERETRERDYQDMLNAMRMDSAHMTPLDI